MASFKVRGSRSHLMEYVDVPPAPSEFEPCGYVHFLVAVKKCVFIKPAEIAAFVRVSRPLKYAGYA